MRLLFAACLIILLSTGSFAQSFYHIIYDGNQSEVMAAGNMRTLHKAVYSLQDRYLPDSITKERAIGGKLLGVGYRAVKGLLLDFQEDYLIALAQHEMFGHGARFREFGFEKNSYHLSMFLPFGNGGGFARAGKLKDGEAITPHEDLTIALSGNEANLLLAGNITDGVLLNNSMHYREAILYFIAQNNQFYYIWRTKLKTGDPGVADGDMTSYLSQLNDLYLKPGKKPLTIDELSTQSLISILNPLQLYAAFSAIYVYGIEGRKRINDIPMIHIGNVRYLPVFNYSLTPFGSQYHFTNYLKYREMLLAAEITVGDKRFNDFYGLQLRGMNVMSNRWLSANLYISMWNQPELQLESLSRSFHNKTGGLVKADINFHPFNLPNKVGGFLQLGYKTKGYTMGEALDEGMVLRFGLSFKASR